MLTLLIAAQLAVPTIAADSRRPRSEDAPAELLREGVPYYVRYALVVTPEGRIVRCQILASSGDKSVDAHTCRIARRTKLRPAIGRNGQPTYGVHRDWRSYWVSSVRSPPPPPQPGADLELVLAKLPPGETGSPRFGAFIEVSPAGDITACEVKHPARANDALAKVACSELKSNYKPKLLALDASGNPVSFVSDAWVRFVAERR